MSGPGLLLLVVVIVVFIVALSAFDAWTDRRDRRSAHDETVRDYHRRGIPVPDCLCDRCKAARIAHYG